MENVFDFYRGKRVLITGHTGFKGAWLSRILQRAGALVSGYALAAEKDAAYHRIVDHDGIASHIGDIREYKALKAATDAAQPEIIFHLAAQPLVLHAFHEPAYTFDVNVLGTVNLAECVRTGETAKSVLIVTTDKVYQNRESDRGYREDDVLGDKEPYAASKACAEIVSASYYGTFLREKGVSLSTARAGNVIGGGDEAENRIVPDCIRAARERRTIGIRHPQSVRPYQHVLEPLFAYMLIAKKQYENSGFSGRYNIGPAEKDCISTAQLADLFCDAWGDNLTWEDISEEDAPHESGLLKLDCSFAGKTFNWHPVWDVRQAVQKTIEWEKADQKQQITDEQIDCYRKAFEDE